MEGVLLGSLIGTIIGFIIGISVFTVFSIQYFKTGARINKELKETDNIKEAHALIRDKWGREGRMGVIILLIITISAGTILANVFGTSRNSLVSALFSSLGDGIVFDATKLTSKLEIFTTIASICGFLIKFAIGLSIIWFGIVPLVLSIFKILKTNADSLDATGSPLGIEGAKSYRRTVRNIAFLDASIETLVGWIILILTGINQVIAKDGSGVNGFGFISMLPGGNVIGIISSLITEAIDGGKDWPKAFANVGIILPNAPTIFVKS